MAAWAGKGWLEGKLRTLQSQLDSTNQRLQTELDKGLHVHKVQFEKEFQIYEELWAKLVDLQTAALSLRPEIDPIDLRESRKNRPFYSEEVYLLTGDLWKLTRSEMMSHRRQDPQKENYWETAEKNRIKILSVIEDCCEKIRERIGSISVLD